MNQSPPGINTTQNPLTNSPYADKYFKALPKPPLMEMEKKDISDAPIHLDIDTDVVT